MKKMTWLMIAAAAAGVLSATWGPQDARAEGACVRKEFKTTLVKDACTKGGQDEAKKAMKKFLVVAKAKNPSVTDCKSCHASLAPDFRLTPDGLLQFQRSGGK